MPKTHYLNETEFITESQRQNITWKPIMGFKTYEISDKDLKIKCDGEMLQVSVIKREGGRIRYVSATPISRGKGYKSITLNGKVFRLHRIRLQTFKGDPPEGKETVRHIDGKSDNNDIDNLAWGTSEEQGQDNRLHGTSRGENNPSAKRSENEVVAIYILAHLGLISKANCKEMIGLSYTEVYKIKTGEAWANVINDNIRRWIQIAIEQMAKNEIIQKDNAVLRANENASMILKKKKSVVKSEIKGLLSRIESLKFGFDDEETQ